jgi:FkbM family methyltransferase
MTATGRRTTSSRWRPGLGGRLRAAVRRGLTALVGDSGEARVRRWYHRMLRSTGRFGLPEEPATVDMLRAVAGRANTIVDVGGNVGRYAWFLRASAPPGGQLIAIEPHPAAAQLLRSTLDGLPGCTVLELAVADMDGTAQLVVPDGAFGQSLSALAWIELPRDRTSPGIEVPLRRIDGLVADGSLAVAGPVFMKIDVEGSEGRVLRGAAAFLRRYRPVVYFECERAALVRQGDSAEAVWAELARAGYATYAQVNGRFVPVRGVDPRVSNYLALPVLPGRDDRVSLDRTALGAVLDAWAAETSARTVTV